MMVYICTKFHGNILNGNRVMERTRNVNGRTEGTTKYDPSLIGWLVVLGLTAL